MIAVFTAFEKAKGIWYKKTMPSQKILIVEDDDSLRRIMEYNLSEEGYDVSVARDGNEGLSLFSKGEFDLCITDLQMPGMDGMEVLKRVKDISPGISVIIVTAFGTVEKAVEGMKAGAYDFIAKPFGRDHLKLTVKKALEYRVLKDENVRLKAELHDKFRFDNIIGVSPKMAEVFGAVERVAGTNSTILLLGESGTGKELIAKAIHYNSSRKDAPFVVVDCTAIPRDLMESELFGHLKGSFTGAFADKKGKMEVAEGGTVFLDEIGDMSTDLQGKLLRFLQEREFTPVGGNKSKKADVRVLAATHVDLEEAILEGRFREDLYYRLNVIPITVPPLRERREDIPELIAHFLKKYEGKGVVVRKEAMDVLMRYTWPGNVRELENTVARLIVMRKGREITIEDLSERIREVPRAAGLVNMPEDGISLDELEKEAIFKALEMNNWNQSRAARFLKIPRHVLLYRMGKFGIDMPKK